MSKRLTRYNSKSLRIRGTSVKIPVVRPMPKLNPRQTTQVKKLVSKKMEKKYHDQNIYNPISPTFVGNITQLTMPAQGTTDTTRVGDTINISSIRFMFSIFRPQVGTGSAYAVPNIGRVIIFQWKGPNATVPVPSDILQTVGTSVGVHSAYTVDQKINFTVAYDKSFSFSQNGNAERIVRKVISGKKLKKKIQFNAGSALVFSDAIYVLFITDNGASDINQVTSFMRSRILYTDA